MPRARSRSPSLGRPSRATSTITTSSAGNSTARSWIWKFHKANRETPMIKFYYSTAPNPMKVALCLEEMGLAYEPIPVDTRKGEQHKSNYLTINPNAKVPSIVDGAVTVFDSNAIVLYLGEKTGKF